MCAHACWELNSGTQLPTLSSPQEYGERGAVCCHQEQCSAPHVEQAEFQHICLSHCVSCVCVCSLVFSLCAGLREGRRCSGRPVGAGTQGSISLTQAQVLPNSKITAAVPEQLLRRSCCDISTWMAHPFSDLPVQESHQVC